MGFSWSRDDELTTRRVWVHFTAGVVVMRVPFWMPIACILRDAKERMPIAPEPTRVEENDGSILWQRAAPDLPAAEKPERRGGHG